MAGNAVDISYSAGNLTDSSLIGNSSNQPYLATLTNQSCTNNVSGAPSSVRTATYFTFNYLRGTEAAPIREPYPGAGVSTAVKIVPSGAIRVRIKVACTTADCAPTGLVLRYSLNGGAYTAIPNTAGADAIQFVGAVNDPGIPTSGTITTEQLTSDYATNVACAVIRTASTVPTVTLPQNSETECEWAIQLIGSTPGATYDFRPYTESGAALDVYTVTPRATVTTSAGSGL